MNKQPYRELSPEEKPENTVRVPRNSAEVAITNAQSYGIVNYLDIKAIVYAPGSRFGTTPNSTSLHRSNPKRLLPRHLIQPVLVNSVFNFVSAVSRIRCGSSGPSIQWGWCSVARQYFPPSAASRAVYIWEFVADQGVNNIE